jgi:hypothetical protein
MFIFKKLIITFKNKKVDLYCKIIIQSNIIIKLINLIDVFKTAIFFKQNLKGFNLNLKKIL